MFEAPSYSPNPIGSSEVWRLTWVSHSGMSHNHRLLRAEPVQMEDLVSKLKLQSKAPDVELLAAYPVPRILRKSICNHCTSRASANCKGKSEVH